MKLTTLQIPVFVKRTIYSKKAKVEDMSKKNKKIILYESESEKSQQESNIEEKDE